MGIPTLIATNPDSTDIASIEFTSSIDSTYDEYMFVFTDINPATDGQPFTFQASTDSGSNYNTTLTTTYFDFTHGEGGSEGQLEYTAARDIAQGTGFQQLTESTGNAADESCAGILHLFNPASTTYVKHFYAQINSYDYGNASLGTMVAGYFNTTSAIDAIQFKFTSGNMDGVIQMYGIS